MTITKAQIMIGLAKKILPNKEMLVILHPLSKGRKR